MTAAKLVAIREELGWTQDQLGRAILLPPKNAGRTIRRYESGHPMPGPIEIAVRAIKDGFSLPHIEAIRAEASAARPARRPQIS
ncbi:MAG: helix-turn-helix transcriptional regulator [Tagaea sp.]|nr:helix-turn-helix transcriptional regulator [Tagaea sp.]